MTVVAMFKPTGVAERIEALDVLRGFALCGVFLVNVSAMGRSLSWNFPAGSPSGADASWRLWLAQQLLLEGAMRGLFTLLFGAGVLYLTRRADGPDAPVAVADVYLRRCLGLMGLGLANVLLLAWPGDIVFDYGLTGLFLFAFRRCRPRVLTALAIALLLILTGVRLASDVPRLQALHAGERATAALQRGDASAPALQAALTARHDAIAHGGPDVAAVDAETQARRGGPISLLEWSYATWTGLTLNPVILPGLMECAAFMLLGMALLKTNVLSGARSAVYYARLAFGGLAVALVLRGPAVREAWIGYAHPTAIGGIVQTTFYEAGRAAMTLGWLGGVLLACKRLPRIALAPLRALGRMALTNYLGQSVIAAALFYGARLYGRLDWPKLWVVAALACAMQAALSLAWLAYFQAGPAEWLLRSVAYNSRQPFRADRHLG